MGTAIVGIILFAVWWWLIAGGGAGEIASSVHKITKKKNP